MRCPFCGYEEDKVVDSRPVQDGRAIRRRRECLKCNDRYTTYEYIEGVSLTVAKSGDRREPFDRTKIINGIKLACNKRPVGSDQIESMVNEIEATLNGLPKNDVTSKFIGELVMEKLKDMDDISYVRFASVYRKFADADEFLQEIKKLLK